MIRLYLRNGWTVLWQKGSHVQVGKGSARTTIPMHRELKKGTEHGLLKILKRTDKEEQ